ncbi:MAG: DUF4474 domain-containing protein [Clostridia bacterium]|nr:DUF4474 domain-containing protein [Clostridia bacterium]MBR6005635.1 DUF4474 domain-containing protein [Clostridia bacterium]
MNNKDKYIAEVEALKAGDDLKKAILEKADKKPQNNAYKKIIPLAASFAVVILVAVLVAVPATRNRAALKKDAAAVEYACDAKDEAEGELYEYNAARNEEYDNSESGAAGKSAESGTGAWYVDALNRGLSDMEQKALLGYSYDSEGDCFYTDDRECWQSGFSYNEIYDRAAGFPAMYIDRLRIRFDYDDLAWMIQLWKGQYGWTFVGGEIGVYTSDRFKTSEINSTQLDRYECPDESDWLNMSMDIYWDKEKDGDYDKLLSRPYAKYWWCNGFRFGILNKFTPPITELIMQARITFKSSAMANLFTTGMKKGRFRSAASASNLSKDSIYQSGSDVYFRWYTVY